MTHQNKHILFDLDGTIIDSMQIFHEIDAKVLAENGVEITQPEFHQMQYSDGFSVVKTILEQRTNFTTEKVDQIMNRILIESYEEISRRVSYYPDIKQLLELKNSDSSKITKFKGVITRSSLSSISKICLSTNFQADFTLLVNGDETKGRHKPDPYPLILATEKLSINPQDCIYIGDHLEDLKAAKSAGMTACLVLRPHVPQSLKSEADIYISNFLELL